MENLKANQKIWLVVSQIPEGKVATYGQIAEMAKMPRRARLVGNVLSQLPTSSTLPWHRVINARGELSFSNDSPRYHKQKELLESEGIIFINAKVKLSTYQWAGE